MALQKIGDSKSDDVFYRYKIPKLITKIKGHGYGSKTNIYNMVDVAKALARPASYTTRYLGFELGAQSKFDGRVGVIKGSHDSAELAGLLKGFIEKYVQCYSCGNLETEILTTENQMVQLNCASCGYASDVDMTDKLTSFILKYPPVQKKNIKDKKAKRRAEKECLQEGETADKVMNKVTKDVKKTKDGHGTQQKGSGTDEYHVSSTVSEAGDNDSEEDADVQWPIGTSAEAAVQLIQEKLSTITADKDDPDEDDDGPWLIDKSAEAALQLLLEQLSTVTVTDDLLRLATEKPLEMAVKPVNKPYDDPWTC